MCGIARLQATQEVFADDERWAGLSPVDLVRAAVAETVAISLRHERYLRAVVLVSAAHAGVRRRGSRYRQALGEEFAGVVLRSPRRDPPRRPGGRRPLLPAPVDDDAFTADLGETAVRYLLDAAPG